MPALFTRLPLPSLRGSIYRSAMPYGRYDRQGQLLLRYREHRIAVVLVLTEAEECSAETGRNLFDIYRSLGLLTLHLPIPDRAIPKRDELERALDAIIDHTTHGRNVAIHCSAGIGRTGLVAACLARKLLGLDGGAAVAWIRNLVPGAVETAEQEAFVCEPPPYAIASYLF